MFVLEGQASCERLVKRAGRCFLPFSQFTVFLETCVVTKQSIEEGGEDRREDDVQFQSGIRLY